jgi:hypothetical protein
MLDAGRQVCLDVYLMLVSIARGAIGRTVLIQFAYDTHLELKLGMKHRTDHLGGLQVMLR